MNGPGTVEAIHIAPEGGADVNGVDEIEAVGGSGLCGDRYFAGEGTFSDGKNTRRHLSLIEGEAVDAIKRESDIELEPGAHRRNVTTRGVALNHLVGEEFFVGEARCRGLQLCEPCSHLESLTTDGVLQGLIHRGGLYAEILDSGTIRVGDDITR